MKNSILIFVPTRNRAEMVKDVLEFEVEYYKKHNIDLMYFDSSDSDETRCVIQHVSMNTGYNIGYEYISPKWCLDYKIIEIFKILEKTDYQYFWMINDSISISEEMIAYVKTLITKDNYDLLRLPLSGAGNIEDHITTDVDDWFNNCSQGMGHMASTIMSKSLFEVEHDWEYLGKKYIYNNTLDENHGFFFTVGFYLEQIAKMRKFKGVFIGNKIKWRCDSPLKGKQMYWWKYIFETWVKSYVETIMKLPDVYTNKEQVIYKSDNLSPGRFSRFNLIHYRLCGIYDLPKFFKYKKYIKLVSDESKFTFLMIALQPLWLLKLKHPNLVSFEECWEEKLEIIERRIEKQNIIIYGAGLYGCKVLQKLIKDGFEKQITGIAVTKSDDNVTELNGYRVKCIDDYNISSNNFIIACALPDAAFSMEKELKKRGIKNYISLFSV